MASRMMHLIIGEKVFRKLKLQDESLFLLGSVAPDAVFDRELKDRSHFYEGSSSDNGVTSVNYEAFISKYRHKMRNVFMLGYLTHLVSDDVWLQLIYYKNRLKERLEEEPGLLERWHNDFRNLNGKLVRWYNCDHIKEKIAKTAVAAVTVEAEEIRPDDLEAFRVEAVNDFTFRPEDVRQPLHVYDFDEIVQYIDVAVRESADVCRSILEGQ